MITGAVGAFGGGAGACARGEGGREVAGHKTADSGPGVRGIAQFVVARGCRGWVAVETIGRG